MKISIKIIIFAVSATITIFSCAKNETGQSTNDKILETIENSKVEENLKTEKDSKTEENSSIEEIVEQVELPKPVEVLKKAIVMTDKNYLCLFGRDEKMHKITKLNKSNTVDILYTDGVCETKEVNGKSYSHAVHDNCDYWVDTSTLAFNSVPAIIIENATIYTNKNFTSVGNATLKFGRTVALSIQEENTENSKMVYYIDSQSGTLKSGWVKNECVSRKNDDIVVMQIVESLKATTRATARNELFKKASRYKPSAKVAAAVEAQKVELIEENYEEVLNALPRSGARYKVNVEELLTVDQSKDPFK